MARQWVRFGRFGSALLTAVFCFAPWRHVRAAQTDATPVPKTILNLDFATAGPEQVQTPEDAARAVLTSNAAEEVDGEQSLKGDSESSIAEWNEFFHSRPDLFPPHEAYRVSFDYRILARAADANFYTLFRRVGAKNTEGEVEWKGEPGATGHIDTAFSPRGSTDFFWIIGIHKKGSISINHLKIVTDPVARPPDLPKPVRTWKSAGNTTYYVDSQSGSDAADGKSAATAWRSLERVNSGTFAPGDRIFLAAGGVWTGYLSPGGSGSEGKPIVVDNYQPNRVAAALNLPRIDAFGKFLATVYLANSEYFELRSLDVANSGPTRFPGLAGVMVSEQDFGTAHHIVLSGLRVHDVMGSNVKDAGGGTGIVCNNGGRRVQTRYDGLTIENCFLQRTDRNGIGINGNWQRDASWFPSLHVVIRGNNLFDIGGDGIVPIGCDGALIERNVLERGRMRALDYAAGIWPWSCDNTTIQYNEVSFMHGTNDGEGFDSDYNCRGSLFQYNYSHDNDGGFMLICDDGGQHPPYNIGNSGTIIRYNVSSRDGLHTFNITGPCRDTTIYNNTFYVGKGQKVALVASGNWGGAFAADTRFYNNLFDVKGEAAFDLGGMTGVRFDHNAFWGAIKRPPHDPHAVNADPRVPAPDPPFVNTRRPVVLRPDSLSPLKHAGLPGLTVQARDFSGKPVPAGDVTIGAFQ